MALDEPDENDVTESVGGILYCMEKDLARMTGSVRLDLSCMGFQLVPERPLNRFLQPGACCSTGCGSGGCGTGGCGS